MRYSTSCASNEPILRREPVFTVEVCRLPSTKRLFCRISRKGKSKWISERTWERAVSRYPRLAPAASRSSRYARRSRRRSGLSFADPASLPAPEPARADGSSCVIAGGPAAAAGGALAVGLPERGQWIAGAVRDADGRDDLEVRDPERAVVAARPFGNGPEGAAENDAADRERPAEVGDLDRRPEVRRLKSLP